MMEVLRRLRLLHAVLVKELDVGADIVVATWHDVYEEIGGNHIRSDNIGTSENELVLQFIQYGFLHWEEVPLE